jgi:PD-(D/E)XK nuclease superfamily
VSLYVMEHKTSSEDIGPGSIYWRKLTLDSQVSNYLVGARALGHEPVGVIYDVLRKPALEPMMATPVEARKYTKPTKTEPSRLYASQRESDEAPLDYRDRLLEDIAARPDHYYQRGVVVRLEEEEREAAHDTWQTAVAIRDARASGVWPRNVDSCQQYHRMCEYWPVCSGETTLDDFRYEHGRAHPELSDVWRGRELPVLTSSSARCHRACPRRYQFAYELGVRPRERAGSLRFGHRLHVGLEVWMQTKDVDASVAASISNPYDFESAKAEAMLRGYDARWRNEPLETVGVEVEFSAPLINPDTGAKSRTFVRAGKIDAIVRRLEV